MRPTALATLIFAGQLIAKTTAHVSNEPRIRVTTSLVNFDARIIDQWRSGGGANWTISNDTSHPFTGRELGGGTRSGIHGTEAFGRGYTYGVNDTSTLAGHPFPGRLWDG